jgi:hypothetical protein
MIKRTLVATLSIFAIAPQAMAHDTSHNARVDDHGPIGVMGDHMHKAGEWMTSYRYSHMEMSDIYDGDDKLSPAQTRAKGYMMAPTEMSMDMHMFGAMYGITDDLTVMAMGSYIEKEMTMENGSNALTTNTSKGLGDTKLTLAYRLKELEGHRFQLNTGLSLPTGSIDKKSKTGAKLAYPMQLGSGTFDLQPSLTYAGHHGDWGWGGQAAAVLHLGRNSDHYSLGDEFKLTAWGSRRLNKSFSASLRVEGKTQSEIDGSDPDFASKLNMAPGFRTENYGGSSIDGAVGINYLVQEGQLKGHRLAAEFIAPLYQNMNGIKLGNDYRLVVGWQKSF